MKIRFPRYGVYHGRLAFDGEFHIDPAGRRLVTDGEGSYRYARRGDLSHLLRFHRATVVIASTTADDPHHVSPPNTDPHRHELSFHPDREAATVTSHTS